MKNRATGGWIGLCLLMLCMMCANANAASGEDTGTTVPTAGKSAQAQRDADQNPDALETRLQQRLRVLLKLLDEDDAASLLNAQMAWRNFRDETCTVEASAIAPRANAAGLVEYTRRGCERRMTERRLVAIDRYIDILQGRASYAELAEREPQLYAIGVYAGRAPDTARAGDEEQGVVLVHVRKRTHPLVLSLSAYEPVHWKLVVDPGVVLRRVILTGYHAQTISGLPAGVSVVRHGDARNEPPHYYAYKKDDQYFKLAKYLKGLTGLDVASFQGRYKGGDFVVE